MGETATNSSRLGARNTGEIVEVQGGHIVRSTGRKDRHSKVCTAKGPRDRRVRLSAHTAIQFYDVQDRLGYDRPSKAVDWLIKKAKAAIDELAELPAWTPTATKTNSQQDEMITEDKDYNLQNLDVQNMEQNLQENPNNNSSFLPPSLDSDAIADTIKSFFPMGAASVETSSSSSIQFQSYPVPDLLSRTSSQNQDLRLSLQSFQEPILLHHHHQNEHQVLFSATNANQIRADHPLGFDGLSTGWSDHHSAETSRFQRAWNSGGAADTGCGGGGSSGGNGGFIFNSALPQTVSPPPPLLQPLFGGQSQFFSQRGPLQSSNTPSLRAWIDPAIGYDHHHNQITQIYPQQSAIAGIGFSGFRVPTRIQGEEEEHDGIHNKPSSVSSDSRH